LTIASVVNALPVQAGGNQAGIAKIAAQPQIALHRPQDDVQFMSYKRSAMEQFV
jgi:hypothetical protein